MLGLEWDASSAQLDPIIVMTNMVRDSVNSVIDGKYHFQLLADGVSCYRHMSVCNVGIKLFNDSPTYNSLTSMKVM